MRLSRHFDIQKDASGAPVFIPAASGATADSQFQIMSPLVSGPESDSNDVYWDDHFGVMGANNPVFVAAADGLGNVYVSGPFQNTPSILSRPGLRRLGLPAAVPGELFSNELPMELGVNAAVGQQGCVRAALDNPPFV